MANAHKYGLVKYEGAMPGDAVRYAPGALKGQGVVLKPRSRTEVNGVLQSVKNGVGFVRLLPQLQTTAVGVAGGSASGIKVNLPVAAGGKLRIG